MQTGFPDMLIDDPETLARSEGVAVLEFLDAKAAALPLEH